jgi:hypothetical protein
MTTKNKELQKILSDCTQLKMGTYFNFNMPRTVQVEGVNYIREDLALEAMKLLNKYHENNINIKKIKK